LVLRQSHAGGEKLFVEAGAQGADHERVEPVTCLRDVDQQFADWMKATYRLRPLRRRGPVAGAVVPRAAVIKRCPFDPTIKRSYTGIARHYDVQVSTLDQIATRALCPVRPAPLKVFPVASYFFGSLHL